MDRHTDRQTGMTKLTVAVGNFAKASKKWILIGQLVGGFILPRDERRLTVHPVTNFVPVNV